MAKDYRGVVIAGYGETAYQRSTSADSKTIIAEAIRTALGTCRITPSEVDGLSVTSFLLSDENTITIAAHLGFSLRWALQGIFGNASGLIAVMQAARAIQAGDANTVVVVGADAYDITKHMVSTARFAPATRDYLGVYGFGGSNGVFALVQRLHMERYGTTREQLGKLAVTQRQNAQLNENALLRKPMTLDDYLNARLIADPIRLLDCVLPCSGGDALVLTSEDHARRLGVPGVSILAGGQSHNDQPNSIVHTERGWRTFAADMFQAANIGAQELDMLQLYDNYPILELIQFEEFGLCPTGEGGHFVETNDFSLNGNLPLNTGGGQLSGGQAGAGGGLLGAVEAVRQLRGEAGRRQLQSPRTALVTGFGMVSYGRELSNSALILGGPSL